jgi:hypothetical protein
MPEDIKASLKADREELAAARHLLSEAESTVCQIHLIRSLVVPSTKNTRHLDITANLAAHFKAAILDSLVSAMAEALDTADGIASFDYASFSDGRMAALRLGKHAEVLAWLSKFSPVDKIESLKGDVTFLTRLKLTHSIITLLPSGARIDIFKKTNSSPIAKKKIFASLIAGETYDYVNPETTLLLDPAIDFIVFRKTLFIVNVKNFEAILNFRVVTEAVAKKSLAVVLAALPVSDPKGLTASILTGTRRLNKLASLDNKAHVKELSMLKIQELIKDKNLPIQVADISGVLTLQVDSNNKDHIQAYLHILSDDYVRSILTDIEYIGVEKSLL